MEFDYVGEAWGNELVTFGKIEDFLTACQDAFGTAPELRRSVARDGTVEWRERANGALVLIERGEDAG